MGYSGLYKRELPGWDSSHPRSQPPCHQSRYVNQIIWFSYLIIEKADLNWNIIQKCLNCLSQCFCRILLLRCLQSANYVINWEKQLSNNMLTFSYHNFCFLNKFYDADDRHFVFILFWLRSHLFDEVQSCDIDWVSGSIAPETKCFSSLEIMIIKAM